MLVGGLALRLGWLQVVQAHAFASAASAEHSRRVPIPATRGEIVDDQGNVLAVSVPAVTVTADQAQIKNKPATAQPLSGILNLSAAQILALLQQPGQFAYLEQDATPAQGAAVDKLNLTGIYTHTTSVRHYPDGLLLGHTLGFVGANGQGLDGVELSYQAQLAGKAGWMQTQVDAYGQPIPSTTTHTQPPVPGDTLELTINSGLQLDLQDILQATVADTKAQAAYAIVLQPDTGAILAWGSWPSFDPNHFADVPPSLWPNPMVADTLTPGSVFKPITVAAALSTGIVTPSTPFFDPGVLNVGGVSIHNFQTLERNTTFARAFDESANVVFGTVGLKLGIPTFYHYLSAFGLTGPTGIDLPGFNPNQIIAQNQANQLTLAENSFGQSINVSPLSLITALNAIADGGKVIQPHVAKALLSPSGKVLETIQPKILGTPISASVAATVRQMMVGVVDNGTGERAFIPCYDVGGKTGTSTDGYSNNTLVASFVALAPASSPQAIVLVQLLRPQGYFTDGGEVAAPVAQALLADAMHMLGVPPDCTATNTAPPVPGSAGTTSLILHMVPMPAIVNDTPTQAQARAQQVGLVLQISGKGQTILHQNPPAGAEVQQWTSVYGYTDPSGPVPGSEVTVPSVLGQTIGQATQTLVQANLALNTSGVGVAIDENPPAGQKVPPGTGVSVVFAQSSATGSGSTSN